MKMKTNPELTWWRGGEEGIIGFSDVMIGCVLVVDY